MSLKSSAARRDDPEPTQPTEPYILVGESTGILVIPAAIAEKVADKALEHDEEEAFQRELLLKGESIFGVYPMSAATRKRFEEWKKVKSEKWKVESEK